MGKLISIFVENMDFKFCGPNNAKFDTEQNMCEKSMSYYIYIYIYMYPRLPQHFLRKHGVSLRTNIGKKYAIKSRKNPLMICEEINREGQEKSTGAMDEYIEDDIHPHHEGHISEKIIENAEETIKEPKSTPVEDRKGQNTVSIKIEADDTKQRINREGQEKSTGAIDEYIEDDIHPHREGHISVKIFENAEETIKEPKSTPVEDRGGKIQSVLKLMLPQRI